MLSVYEDAELYDWLRWADQHGGSFLRAIAEAAFLADLKHYNMLRPVLLELRMQWPISDQETFMCGRYRLPPQSRMVN